MFHVFDFSFTAVPTASISVSEPCHLARFSVMARSRTAVAFFTFDNLPLLGEEHQEERDFRSTHKEQTHKEQNPKGAKPIRKKTKKEVRKRKKEKQDKRKKGKSARTWEPLVETPREAKGEAEGDGEGEGERNKETAKEKETKRQRKRKKQRDKEKTFDFFFASVTGSHKSRPRRRKKKRQVEQELQKDSGAQNADAPPQGSNVAPLEVKGPRSLARCPPTQSAMRDRAWRKVARVTLGPSTPPSQNAGQRR